MTGTANPYGHERLVCLEGGLDHLAVKPPLRDQNAVVQSSCQPLKTCRDSGIVHGCSLLRCFNCLAPSAFDTPFAELEDSITRTDGYEEYCALKHDFNRSPIDPICYRQDSVISFFDPSKSTFRLSFVMLSVDDVHILTLK